MKTISAILLGKAIFATTRFLKLGGGYAAPGLYALKIDPNLVRNLSRQIPQNIIITGTNGKTTTATMLAHLYKSYPQKVLRNSTGSNLERGIASTLIKEASFGKIKKDIGIWEVDEAAFNSLAPKIKPDLVVFLNVFRDQLDRYGEVDSIVNKWVETIKLLPEKTQYLINGDDGSLGPLLNFKNTHTYSIQGVFINSEKKSLKKPVPRFLALHKKASDESTEFKFRIDDCQFDVILPLPGDYNIYNATAALAAKFLMGAVSDKDGRELQNFKSAFGRFEKFEINGKTGSIFLIKNPAGATQVLQTILPSLKPEDSILLALNDNFADGKDVSWIWDIQIENLKFKISNLKFFVSGSRAYDMALRLKYAGADERSMEITQSLEACFNKAVKETEGKIFILPTYTALLELQKILVKKGIKKEYWKNE